MIGRITIVHIQNLEYKPRIADEILARELEGMGAVLIKGPKWCGKNQSITAA